MKDQNYHFVIQLDNGLYWAGYNKFTDQIRKAQLYNSLKNKIIVNCAEFMLFGQLVFSSSDTCKKAIEELGEMNVRDYILGVKR